MPLHPHRRSHGRQQPQSRRGVTLLELMVVVALLVLIMAILVEIFRSATGALSSQRAFAGIDQELRRVDGLLRQDLGAITAPMDPQRGSGNPLTAPGANPDSEERGYFTWGENSLPDAQGEDTDDYLAFTAELPADVPPFTGFVAVPAAFNGPLGQPTLFNRVPITSRRAEIVYFLRNGNLYRRVFLIVPNRTLTLGWSTAGGGTFVPWFETNPSNANGPWLQPGTGLLNQRVSWLYANDISARPAGGPGIGFTAPVPNTLGDLTNRENRAFSPRFSGDLNRTDPNTGTILTQFLPDGKPDEHPRDPRLHAFYPTLYPEVYAAYMPGPGAAGQHRSRVAALPELLSFPFIYPNGYSVADIGTALQPTDPYIPPAYYRPAINIGPIHSTESTTGNHSPLDLGDPLTQGPNVRNQLQTWWGFPTKKETLSHFWTDPIKRINGRILIAPVNEPLQRQPRGLRPAFPHMARGSDLLPEAMLPPINRDYRFLATEPLFLDGDGTGTAAQPNLPRTNRSRFIDGYRNFAGAEIWRSLPEDDLVMSNVRSFDVKGLNPTATSQDYVDLGYAQTLTGSLPGQLLTLGHEGRIPPLVADGRVDPQDTSVAIGDDTDTIIRMRRVWDSWSTRYSRVPPTNRSLYPPGTPFPPSYPPPYPVPLRGIQIQIRVVDPTNQKIKSHTIRMDFSNNLD